MSVYNVDGNEILSIYKTNGDDVNDAYDIDGNSVYDGTTYGIENVVSYYRERTLEVASEINSLSNDWVSIAITTDSHGASNALHSPSILIYLAKNARISKVISLGDVVKSGWKEEEYETYFASLLEYCKSKLYFALGNHEWYGGGVTWDTLKVIYDDILADKSYLHGNPEQFHYYFDDKVRKIRYLFFNTSDGSGDGMTYEQIDWIRESVALPSSDWNLLLFAHKDINPDDPITSGWIAFRARQIVNAILTTNGRIIGHICGHEHHDRLIKIDDAFYQCTLLNDSCVKDTTPSEIIKPDRTRGTYSEQAVTVVSFNTKTGDVVTRRIGAGNEQSWNYKSA